MIMRLKLYRLLLKIGIYLLPIPAFKLGWSIWVGLCLIFGRNIFYSSHGHLSHIVFGTFVWALVAEHHRVTNFDEIFRERTGAHAAGSACIATSFVLLATLYFSRDQVFPRALLVCDIFALLLLTMLFKAALRTFCKSRAHLARPIRLLIVGADQFARAAAARLLRWSFAPIEIAGFVRLPGQDVSVVGHRIFEVDELAELNYEHGIDEALMAIHPAQFHRIPQIMPMLNRMCLPTRAVVDLGENIVVREKLFQLGSMQMLDLMSTPTESLDYALLKRIFDVCFAALMLILTAPLMALIAILIKCTSRGPVFFVQDRVGLNGRTFRMYKFRTMRMSAQADSDKRWTTEAIPFERLWEFF